MWSTLALFSILVASSLTTAKPRLVSWYGKYNDTAVPASWSPDDLGRLGFTHVVASAGTGLEQDAHGHVSCNRSSSAYQDATPLREAATRHGFKLMALLKLNGTSLVKGDGLTSEHFKTYLRSIGAGAKECGVQGAEWDYEPVIELSADRRKKLTMVLGQINNATDDDFDLALDILVWGDKGGEGGSDAPLDFRPYIDVEMTNAGLGPTFINTESYHWPLTSSIDEYKSDARWTTFWGLDKSRVNFGPPMYSWNNGKVGPKKHHGEPTWHTLSPFCPDIAYDGVRCDGLRVNSREMMYDLGRFIASEGWGGAFPWAADYDTPNGGGGNLSLIEPLARGMGLIG